MSYEHQEEEFLPLNYTGSAKNRGANCGRDRVDSLSQPGHDTKSGRPGICPGFGAVHPFHKASETCPKILPGLQKNFSIVQYFLQIVRALQPETSIIKALPAKCSDRELPRAPNSG
jgi:hypothetical protein